MCKGKYEAEVEQFGVKYVRFSIGGGIKTLAFLYFMTPRCKYLWDGRVMEMLLAFHVLHFTAAHHRKNAKRFWDAGGL